MCVACWYAVCVRLFVAGCRADFWKSHYISDFMMMFIQFLIYYPKRLHSSMHTHQRGTTTKPQTFSWKGANNNDDKIFKKTRLTQATLNARYEAFLLCSASVEAMARSFPKQYKHCRHTRGSGSTHIGANKCACACVCGLWNWCLWICARMQM